MAVRWVDGEKNIYDVRHRTREDANVDMRHYFLIYYQGSATTHHLYVTARTYSVFLRQLLGLYNFDCSGSSGSAGVIQPPLISSIAWCGITCQAS